MRVSQGFGAHCRASATDSFISPCVYWATGKWQEAYILLERERERERTEKVFVTLFKLRGVFPKNPIWPRVLKTRVLVLGWQNLEISTSVVGWSHYYTLLPLHALCALRRQIIYSLLKRHIRWSHKRQHKANKAAEPPN